MAAATGSAGGAETDRLAPQEAFERKGSRLTLQDCIDMAFQRSRLRTVSGISVDIARHQHEQALSAYWPQVSLRSSATRMDENPNFIFPAQTFPGFGQIPAQNVKLFDRDLLSSTISLLYPLYTGGKISSVAAQAKVGIDVAREEARQTDLQVIRDIRQYYYGHALAKRLHVLGKETMERLEATLDLTESLYKNGSGRTKKTDYLRTQVITASVRSAVELLKSNEELSRSALVNTIGLEWNMPLEIADTEIPFSPFGSPLEKLVETARTSNPQMTKVRLGLKASQSKIEEAGAGHLPVVVFFSDLNRYDNAYRVGLMTDENRNSWKLGIGLELPIFNGFRTTSQVKEARARLEKLKEESLLLSEGVALQVKDAFLQIGRSQNQVKSTKEALVAAQENRELNIRAFQQELVEAKDVIEAQLIEFFIHGQYLKALYDNQVNMGNIEFMLGSAIRGTP